MANTVLQLTPEEKRAYRPFDAIRRREAANRSLAEIRWRKARQLAKQAAAILHEDFGAEKVLLFGSAANRSWFTLWSDVDLAAWGVAADQFYAAVAAVTALSTEIKIDLVDPESCSPELRAEISRSGTEL